MSIRIDRIEIVETGLPTCYRCRKFIQKGDFRLVEIYNYLGHKKERFYCMGCAGKIKIDRLDKERINLQLANNRLNF